MRLSSSIFAFTAFLSPVNAFWSFRQTKEEGDNGDSEETGGSAVKPPLDYSISRPAPAPLDPPPAISYGVDVSLPIQHNVISDNYAWLPHNLDPSLPVPKEYQGKPVQPLAGRQEFYKHFVDSCVEAFGKKGRRCTDTERDRFDMSLRQPQSMVNYTHIGFHKIKAPPKLWEMVHTFWQKNHHKAKPEQWGVGNTYTNNWEVPSKMVSVENTELRGGGQRFKQNIWNEAKKVLAEWTGQELTQCSLYGIRIYHEGAVLATHVDRLPLVSSAIINIAQDLDEAWPLEVIGHDGVAYNVTMEPGDMVLYESHSVLHGRPFPLKGRYMANLFVHFEPVGHSLRHHGIDKNINNDEDSANERYREAHDLGHGGHEHDTDLPSYIVEDSLEAPHWHQTHPNGQKRNSRGSFTTGSTTAHAAAQSGDHTTLKEEIDRKKDVVNAVDANGWTPLHEGARGGHIEVVKLLVENGADVNKKTGHGGRNGATPLWWAKQSLDADHEVIAFLESIGAVDAGPEL